MNRLLRASCSVLSLWLLFAASPAAAEVEPDGIDIEYAEIARLAAHSLLLDVERNGDRLVAVGERGHVVFSDDNGSTWNQASVVPTRATLTTVLAVQQRLFAAGHDSVILTSGDGGNTWTLQYSDPERLQPIMDLWFADADNGIAIGAYGLILTTTDGGQSWDDWAINDEDDAHLNSIIELSDGVLLIAGGAGFSYRSTDEGETWEPLDLPYQGSLFGAELAGDDCVLFFGLRGHILRSCDESESWDELNSSSENTLAGGTGHAGGALMVGNSGFIVEYKNGGQLSVHSHSSGVDFSTAILLDDGRFLLVGEDGTHLYPETNTGEPKP
jgi:photosystem II stability/assembly factor-like uncharacterized protein